MASIRDLLLVGAGGFVGACLRFLVSGAVMRLDPGGSFPYGTLAVNLLGCFAIGCLGGFADARGALSAEARLALVVGLLGGFTTFSAFAHEGLALLRGGEALRASVYVAVSVLACLLFAGLGYALTNRP